MTKEHAAKVLVRRFGPRAVLARGAGRWSVILMDHPNFGSGVAITDECPTVSRAVSMAIQFAILYGSSWAFEGRG